MGKSFRGKEKKKKKEACFIIFLSELFSRLYNIVFKVLVQKRGFVLQFWSTFIKLLQSL